MDPYPRWEESPTLVKEGVLTSNILGGEDLMFCRNVIAPHASFPRHRHVAEQFAVIISGRLRMYVGDTERIVGPGDVVHVPSNEEHGADSLDEEVVLLEFFNPPRPELLEAIAK